MNYFTFNIVRLFFLAPLFILAICVGESFAEGEVLSNCFCEGKVKDLVDKTTKISVLGNYYRNRNSRGFSTTAQGMVISLTDNVKCYIPTQTSDPNKGWEYKVKITESNTNQDYNNGSYEVRAKKDDQNVISGIGPIVYRVELRKDKKPIYKHIIKHAIYNFGFFQWHMGWLCDPKHQ
ncbi:MAG: hypothetical protein HYT97_06945 [Elusimicrobia bacterium]|nr:hypothetical protein [Elusimicrobiota bacterium]